MGRMLNARGLGILATIFLVLALGPTLPAFATGAAQGSAIPLATTSPPAFLSPTITPLTTASTPMSNPTVMAKATVPRTVTPSLSTPPTARPL